MIVEEYYLIITEKNKIIEKHYTRFIQKSINEINVFMDISDINN